MTSELQMDRPLRILAPQLGFNLTLGGGRYDYEQLAALANLGHIVHVIVPKVNRKETAIPPGVNIQWIHGRRIRYPLTWSCVFLGPILAACRSLQPDILRIHSPYALGLVGLIAGKLMQVPTICVSLHLGDPIPAGRWVEQKLIPRFDGVLCISQATAQAVKELSSNQRQLIEWSYCGIETRFKLNRSNLPLKKELLNLPTNVPIFAFVGALIKRKNLAWLIREVFARYCSNGNSGCLVIAGSGPEESTLRSIASACGLEKRVIFLGRINNEQQLLLYNSATSLLFPSLMEGFGLAPAEALACETPVIVSDRGSLPEIAIHEVTGYVLPIEQGPEIWVEAMERLVSHPELRAQMGHIGSIDVYRRFNWDSNARQAVNLFLKVIQARYNRAD